MTASLSVDSFKKKIPITQDTLDSVLSGDRRSVIRGINLEMVVSTPSSESSSTLIEDYELHFTDKKADAIAAFRTESFSYSNPAKKLKQVSVAVTSIQRYRGAENSKSTHILAASVGKYQSNIIQNLISNLPPDFTLNVKLLLDCPVRGELEVSTYWEFEAAIEKFLSPYSKPSSQQPRPKVRLASAW